jgi:hypothetical protein
VSNYDFRLHRVAASAARAVLDAVSFSETAGQASPRIFAAARTALASSLAKLMVGDRPRRITGRAAAHALLYDRAPCRGRVDPRSGR